MKKLLVKLYSIVPVAIKQIIGKKSWAKKFKNLILKSNGQFREVSAVIKKSYEGHNVEFEYFGSVQNVSKAIKKGIESTLLRNSLKLLGKKLQQEQNAVIFDIGVNFGYLSLVWATTLSKNKGKVIAFEPNPTVYKSFLKAIYKNELTTTINLENKAVGARNETTEIYLNNTTSNLIKNKNTKDAFKVEMMTLDTYIKQNNINRCDLIKIDVDGIELDILRGSIKTLMTFKPIFIVETNKDDQIIEFFMKYHYKVLNMKLEEFELGQELPINIFCVPNRLEI